MKEKDLKYDYNNMMTDFIGNQQGLSIADFQFEKDLFDKAHAAAWSNRGKGMMSWTDLPYNQSEIVKDILTTAEKIRNKYKYFVVLGIGGSALGPAAVFQALCHLRHNELKKEERNAPKFYVEDNVDPERMKSLLDIIDIEKTMFNVITKSGATSETMAQYLIVADIIKSKGLKLKDHIIATTDSKKGNLIKIAKEEKLKTFFIPDGVGGRFSQLSPVGLLPAAVLNIDINQMLSGAKRMDSLCSTNDISKNPALAAAAVSYLSMKKGKNTAVMMPYADSLKFMSDWFAQLWAESLGKAVDKSGKKVFAGQTPVKALGVTDQHSQIQLYTEGPFDKTVTFLAVEGYRNEYMIPHGCKDLADVAFLGGHTLNELILAEMNATEYALTAAKRPNSKITIPCISAFYIGQLLYFYMMQTAFCGEMLNIDAYNQPGVEEGKNATYALLGKKGFEAKKKELMGATKKKKEYIV